MSYISRMCEVTLSDDRVLVEIEHSMVGASETQLVYHYYENGESVRVNEYECDWWGDVIVPKKRRNLSPDEVGKSLTKALDSGG